MGKTARVVSMVCWELFEEQDDAYKQSVLPPDVTARVRPRLIPQCPALAPSCQLPCMLSCCADLMEKEHWLKDGELSCERGPACAQVSVEAGSTFGWERYVGAAGKSIGVDRYGASAPAPILYEKFGITKAAAVEAAKSML